MWMGHSSLPGMAWEGIYAPTKLKKELDTVLALQTDLDTTTKVIQAARAAIEKGNVTPSILDALASMEQSHARLITKAEALYSSLNVHEQFPELTNVSLDFICTLLMACDLKINIHKRAISSFFEWDKLDCTVGSKDKPLGKTLQWLGDADVRDGIQALLKHERCLEEQRPLSLEADNLCQWFGYELSTIQVALRQSENGNYHLILRQHLETILDLQERWLTALCSPSHYASQAQVAIQLADTITGASLPSLCWLTPVVVNNHTNNAEDEDLWGLTDLLGPDTTDLSLEPEQIMLLDVLGVIHTNDQDEHELEAETLSQVSLKWETPHLPALYFQLMTSLASALMLKMIGSGTTSHGHDSGKSILAEQKPWKNDIKDIMQLIFHLSSMATQKFGTACRDLGDWMAHPMLLNPAKIMDMTVVSGY
ncbi:hypothetical protein EDC04DRAFT_2605994 [Pisolithus marmoratus]|nr:hypothetical protein EDC04DRAFT_2605994 [Pisolithus marmoratus]